MSRSGVEPWLATAARLLLGVVLVVAGGLKLPDPAAAERSVRAYQLLGESLVPAAAFALPVIEIAVGVALLAGVFVRTAAVLASLMLATYIGAIASVWARGISIDCGCFGGGGAVAKGQTTYPWEVARDVLLLLVAVALAWRPHSRLALGTPLVPAPAVPVRSARTGGSGTQGEKGAARAGQRPVRNPSRNAARSRARGSSRKQVSRAR